MLVMSWREWGKLDAIGLARLVRVGKMTPKELALQAAEAIQIVNPKINAVLEVFHDVIEDPYKDGMSKEGCLHGVPMLTKDIGSSMKGRLHEEGTLLSKGVRASEDSPYIENLRTAGFNLIGRTATPPFAWTSTTDSFINGITRNPWNLDYTPNGSSGGSAAAVAAGIVPIAMATDAGGSIRGPAGVCGLVGLKPTRGRVPLPRFNELASYLVCEFVITRTVRDTALALDCLSHHKLGDTLMPISRSERPYIQEVSREPGRLHIALSTGKWGREKDVHAIPMSRTLYVAEVLRSLGHIVEEVQDADICDWENLWRVISTDTFTLPKKWKETSDTHSVPINQETLEPPLYWLYRRSQKYNEFDIWRAQEENGRITRHFGRLFERYDLLLTPASADAFVKAGPGTGYSALDKVENEEQADMWMKHAIDEARYLMPGNYAGIPGVALPGGFVNGLPIGVQLYAPWLREDRLLQVAGQLERAKPEWFDQAPPVHISRF